MILNYIWILFFLLSFIMVLFKLIVLGDVTVLSATVNAITDSSKTAFEISLGLTGVMCFWLGIMKVGENGGAIRIFSRLISPFFFEAVSRNSERPSRYGQHSDELFGQYAGTG